MPEKRTIGVRWVAEAVKSDALGIPQWSVCCESKTHYAHDGSIKWVREFGEYHYFPKNIVSLSAGALRELALLVDRVSAASAPK